MSNWEYSIFGNYQNEACFCIHGLNEATKLSLEIRKKLIDSQICRKSDGTVVTVCDFIVQSILVSYIKEHFPEDPIIAEETCNNLSEAFLFELEKVLEQHKFDKEKFKDTFNHISKSVPENVKRFWTIDPIDGTSGFIKIDQEEYAQYCIAIALIENNDCVFSAVSWPSQVRQYTNIKKKEPIYLLAVRNVGSFYSLSSTPTSFNKVMISNKQTNKVKQIFAGPFNVLVRKISQELSIKYSPIKFTSMAKGFAICLDPGALYIRFSIDSDLSKIYDIAPFAMFIEEAGGYSTTSDGSKIIYKNDGLTNANGFLFSSVDQKFHNKLVIAYNKVVQ